MKDWVLFGAGSIARNTIELIGKQNIAYIVDNNHEKSGEMIKGAPVFSFEEKKQEIFNHKVVISVSKKYENEIAKQLESIGIKDYLTFSQLQYEAIRGKINCRRNGIEVYKKCIRWIHSNTVDGKAIICNTETRKGYPEVTGYYIPTLIRWGYRDLAIKFASWLIKIQKLDGSWYDTEGKEPYIFDSAQILKGLNAVREIYPKKKEIDNAILKGCEWIFSCMTSEGRLVTPSEECWGNDRYTCSELIHMYCISPLLDAGKMFDMPEYVEAANKILDYYLSHYMDDILNFSLLSHFYAYVMEALIDTGEEELCREAMDKIAVLQKESGAVPAYRNCDWVCSTGVFQLALVWFRLGDIDKGNRAFEYACKLQNESGGWYGSYLSEENSNEENTYFPAIEISWANKYFLDALYYKSQAEFNLCASDFLMGISKTDGRYRAIHSLITNSNMKVLDVGCGKGRYLRNLLEDYKDNKYYGVDISSNVLKYLEDINVECREGTLTFIPYEDDFFDVTYTCEALEHSVDFESAIREMARVTHKDGLIAVIDKNDSCYGELEIGEWEKWPNEDELKQLMMQYCTEVVITHGLDYENGRNRDLFTSWVGKVR